MKIKIFVRKIIFLFFEFIINLSIYRFDKKKYKNYIISCPAVNTFGDPIQHIDHIRLINLQSKKRHLILCPNIFPINIYLKFFLKKKMYIFYYEIIYLFFNYLLFFLKKITDLPYFYNHFLLSAINRKISDFNYYEKYSKINDKIYDNNKNKYSKKFLNSYLNVRHNNNKLDNLRIRNNLKKKYGHLILKNCPGFNVNTFKSLIQNLEIKREYICLHIRNNYDENEPRSVNNLVSYFPMIDYLKKKFDVVLLGTNKDNSFTNQFLNNKGIINYKFSKHQSPLNDILLISNCKIYFGNFSGPQAIAYTFGKPMILFDGWPIYSFYYNYRNLKIFPKYIFRNNKIVKISELLNSENYFQEHLKDPLRLECSSGDDKLKEVKDLLRGLNNKEILISKKQELFRNILNPIHLGPYYSYNTFCDSYLEKVI